MTAALLGEDQLKRDMNRLRKEFPDLKLGQHYEQFAKNNGYATYAALRADWKAGKIKYNHLDGLTKI
jgi:hypothetical protein